eukprot:TRINITY_DN21637_c0_g1_i1.p1 TRINITY_DN21637_c0_g1~~TRINITY_DN21637_c0_g1_i1.p1  ORF type:complete len:281 (+),score=40.14 TRINITY_DN21637_c0_g1_i1:86-928(+)
MRRCCRAVCTAARPLQSSRRGHKGDEMGAIQGSASEYPQDTGSYTKAPRWMRKNLVLWHSVADQRRERFAKSYNVSKWSERFRDQFLEESKRSQMNWMDSKGDMEEKEPCYSQKPRGIKGFHMGDRIWPIAMLNTNVIYLSVYVAELTLVIPNKQLPLAQEVLDQCVVPIAYWNPKCNVKPFVIDLPKGPVSQPADVTPYWIVKMIDGQQSILKFLTEHSTKYEVINELQIRVAKMDAAVDKDKWNAPMMARPDHNDWVRVKKHGLDDYTINVHCPLRYV